MELRDNSLATGQTVMMRNNFVQRKSGEGMASNNVLKILYVLELLKGTDEYHPINSSQIIEELEKYGLKAERKSIGNYIRILKEELQYDIILSDNKNLGWYMVGQEFEDYELKMLVDAVNSAKFITANNTRKLRKKILNLATKEGKRIISAGMIMEESLKLVDTKFAVKFDTVMRAVADCKQIRFQYQELGANNKKVVKKNGEYYQISPYYLGVWGHEYFVVANTGKYDNVSFYRVDMMKNVEVTEKAIRPMSEVDELKDIGKNGRSFADFIKEIVNLKNGKVRTVKISGMNQLQREVTKKFGNNISFRSQEEGRFVARVDVAESEGFYEWIAQFGNKMKIESPKEFVEGYKRFLLDALGQYE